MILKHYLVIALRHFWRNRLFAFINIFSLAVGISASLLLFMYLRSEWRYDSHHREAERIHRIPLELKSESSYDRFAVNNFLLPLQLKKHFPEEIEAAWRVLPIGRQPITIEGKSYNQDKLAFGEQVMFRYLNIPFVAGKPETALRDSLTCVISEHLATQYFGYPENAVGKFLQFPVRRYKITGVMKRPVGESHLRYEVYLSLPSLNPIFVTQSRRDPTWLSCFNYIVLKKGISAPDLEKRINQIQAQNATVWFDVKLAQGVSVKYFLQPIRNIHLNTSYQGETSPSNSPLHLFILSSIGLFILLMACINYMNLSTARAGQRAQEVGLRKVLGASRRQLLAQFLGESFVLACVSVGLGLAMAEMLLPNFNYLIEKNFEQLPWLDMEFWTLSVGLILTISLLAGIYPALYLSGFPPTWVLQNKSAQRGAFGGWWLNPANLRKGLVIFQFALSISLMIGTLVAYSQWDFMRTQPLGYQKDNILAIDIPVGDSLLIKKLPDIQQQLRENPKVSGTCVTSSVLDGQVVKMEHYIPLKKRLSVEAMHVIYIDEKFIPMLGIQMQAGKNFLPTHPDSSQMSVIVNEAFVQKMGWKNPIGKQVGNSFMRWEKNKTGDTLFCEVIGVVKDFHYKSLQHKIEPLILYYMPRSYGFLMVKTKTENAEATQDWVRQKWQSIDRKHTLDSFVLSKHLERHYEPHGKLVTIFGYFSLLAIIISGLGLLGLTSYLTEQRSKEIGIRRVLGASAGEVVRQFATEFVWLVCFAFLLASPVVYTLMLQWLQSFAYHGQPHASHFIMAGLSALLIAVATVSWLTWRVARRKPSLALRYGG